MLPTLEVFLPPMKRTAYSEEGDKYTPVVYLSISGYSNLLKSVSNIDTSELVHYNHFHYIM